MPTFIDESGDTGRERGSEAHFRLAAAWVPTVDEAERLREGIRLLRLKLCLRADFEFRFSDLNANVRREFFRSALAHQFAFTACHIDKNNVHWQNAPKSSLHWAAATTIAVDLRAAYHRVEAKGQPLRDQVIVDDNSDSDFLKAIATAFRGLRSKCNPSESLTRKPKFRDSKSDELIQLADMVCGAVGSHLSGASSDLFELIADRNLGVTCLP